MTNGGLWLKRAPCVIHRRKNRVKVKFATVPLKIAEGFASLNLGKYN